MEIDEFADRTGLLDLKEMEKVRLLTYFYTRVWKCAEVHVFDMEEWFGSLSLPAPNRSRLLSRIRASKSFIKGSDNSSFKLHGRDIRALDAELGIMNLIPESQILRSHKGVYVDHERMDELRFIRSDKFDLIKLLELCEELNSCYKHGCLHSIIILVRTIIDHVPPIFECKSFGEVANNYGGSKSFRESMRNLNESSRKIADRHLHSHIRKKEVLPKVRQIDFANDLDALLAEIVQTLS